MTDAPTATDSPDPDTFDLDAWLEGVQSLKAVVTLYARSDLAGEIDDIVAELEPIADRVAAHKVGPGDSMADAGVTLADDTARRDELREQLRAKWTEYEASGADFELTQIPSYRFDEIVDLVKERIPDAPFDAPEGAQARVDEQQQKAAAEEITLSSVTAIGQHGKTRTPLTLSREQLTAIEKRFGTDQFGRLLIQSRRLAQESRVDAPFSQRVSAALDENTSG